MALLFMDSFDHVGGVAAPQATKWTGFTSLISTPRTGSHAAFLGNFSATAITRLGYSIPSGTAIIAGFALRQSEAISSIRPLITFQEDAVDHVGVGLTAGRVPFIWRGTTATVLATGTSVLPLNAWNYIEFKATIHDTTGSYELKIDGVTEPNCSATGVDTKNGSTGIATGFRIHGPNIAGGNGWIVDDVYFCDGTTAIRNDFLGPIKIEGMVAQAGNGSNVGLTPSTGTDHGALVDEASPNTTDYNGSATVGTKDTYHFPSMTGTGQILGIQVNVYAAKSDVGARQIAPVVRHGGADYDGANKTLLTSFGYHTAIWAQTPGGTPADWSAADIAALEAGMKVTV